MLASELITKAYYYSGIVGRDAESPDSTQVSDGLDLLNECINEINIDGKIIPPYDLVSVQTPLVPQQEEYIIDGGPIFIESVTLIYDNVRYFLEEATLREFKTNPRALDVYGLPYQYYWQRNNSSGIKVSFYFIPDKEYTAEITGTMLPFSPVEITEDLNGVPDILINYLIYMLADRLCIFYHTQTPLRLLQLLYKYEKKLSKMYTSDLITIKSGLLTQRDITNYGQINLGKGWTP